MLATLVVLLGTLLAVGAVAGTPAATAAGTVAPASATGVAGPSAPAYARKAKDPRRTRGLFVDSYMPANNAGAEFRPIARNAQALWITDYYYAPSTARKAVAEYSRRATRAGKTPVMAIYAIPGRDCGLYSAGGLPSGKAYQRWITAVAAGMKGRKAMVVLEPDAVPFMGDPRCVESGPRQKLLRFAAKKLKQAGAWVYIDGGHSGWRSVNQMAQLLGRSGMKYARGFSTNVGNFRKTGAEKRYAKALVKALARRGFKNRKFVIETARNGGRTPVNGDVCNPTWARVGAAPKLRFKGSFDGTLWIKHPGESDGTCNGGPSSGEWWPDGARRLMGR